MIVDIQEDISEPVETREIDNDTVEEITETNDQEIIIEADIKSTIDEPCQAIT